MTFWRRSNYNDETVQRTLSDVSVMTLYRYSLTSSCSFFYARKGGDTADKTGSKGGESIWGAVPFPDEFHPNNIHDKRGVLSMANKGPNTNRSQFFLCYERQPHLNNLHTVFGRMLDGWDVLDKMERLPVMGATAPKKKLQHCPIDPPVIQRVTVHANPLADEMIVYPTPDGPPEKRV